jgi:hypothetical protein
MNIQQFGLNWMLILKTMLKTYSGLEVVPHALKEWRTNKQRYSCHWIGFPCWMGLFCHHSMVCFEVADGDDLQVWSCEYNE